MGPSGAGKTTLMDMLAQRKVIGNLSGQVLLGGRPVSSSFTRNTAYVPQEDNFIPCMTAWETVMFYADMCMPDSWSRSQREARCQEVLHMMGLERTKNTLVRACCATWIMLLARSDCGHKCNGSHLLLTSGCNNVTVKLQSRSIFACRKGCTSAYYWWICVLRHVICCCVPGWWSSAWWSHVERHVWW